MTTTRRTNLRGRVLAIAGAGVLGAGLIGGIVANASNATGVPATDAAAFARGPAGALTNVLADLVAKGTITQAQSDAITAAVKAATPAAGRPGGPGFFAAPAGLGAAAQYLGLTTEALRQQLAGGKSLADIAAATSGKSRDGLIAALVQAANDRIDQALQDGKLTVEQATAAKAKVSERVIAEVDRTHDARGPRGGGGRHMRP